MQDQLIDEIATIYGGFLRLVDRELSTQAQAASVVEFAPKVVNVLALIYDLDSVGRDALLLRIGAVSDAHRASHEARTAAIPHMVQ